jgi:acetoin utilization protein AcuB
MLVKNWMSKGVITVNVNDSMSDATRIIKENNIGMLPVMKNGKLVGVITDRDLKRASASDATTLEIHELLYILSKIKIKEIMTKDPITVPPDYTIEETAEILMKNKISGVPVIDKGGQAVGVITQTDIFKALISLTGINNRGIQFALIIEDRAGSIRDVTDVIRKYGGRMVSILSSYDRVKKGYRKIYVRFYGIDRLKLEQFEKEAKEAGELLYMVDHRENKREIYAL